MFDAMTVFYQTIFNSNASRIPSYSARRTHQFTRNTVRTNVRAIAISLLGVKLWNSLNISLVNITSRYMFKCHYVNILLSKYIM